jgi:hypothetical protein
MPSWRSHSSHSVRFAVGSEIDGVIVRTAALSVASNVSGLIGTTVVVVWLTQSAHDSPSSVPRATTGARPGRGHQTWTATGPRRVVVSVTGCLSTSTWIATSAPAPSVDIARTSRSSMLPDELTDSTATAALLRRAWRTARLTSQSVVG